ncbi:MAG: hypothetical protein ABI551_01045, partial [Polyangiaceae bacterium]
MKKLFVTVAPWLVVPAFALAAACSSSSSSGTTTNEDADASTGGDSGTQSGGCKAYTPPSGTDLTTPTVSFRKDVLPVLQATCAKSDCHGFPSDPQHFNLYLGLADASDAGPVGSDTPGTASA